MMTAPLSALRPHADDAQIVTQAVERLVAEFPARHRALVATVVARCRHDLAGAPPGAMPELLERLARQRLREGG